MILSAVLAATTVFAGCAKTNPTSAQLQQGTLAMVTQTLQLPAPDNSYSVATASSATQSGSNVQALMAAIDRVSAGLKESNFHLAQTVAQGQNTNNSLSIVDTALGTSLQGVVDSAHNAINYTYTLNGATYFTASVPATGVTGNLTFPASTVSSAFTLTYNIQVPTGGTMVRNISISNATWGNLLFVVTYTTSPTIPSAVKMTGTLSGAPVSGAWNPLTGGSFTDTTGVTQCFNSLLANIGC